MRELISSRPCIGRARAAEWVLSSNVVGQTFEEHAFAHAALAESRYANGGLEHAGKGVDEEGDGGDLVSAAVGYSEDLVGVFGNVFEPLSISQLFSGDFEAVDDGDGIVLTFDLG